MKKVAALALSSLLLAACSESEDGSVGSGGGGATPVAVAGIWNGVVTETDGSQFDLVVGIDRNGETIWSVSDGELSACTTSVSGSTFTCSPSDDYEISGTVDEGVSLTGTVSMNGSELSTFTAAYNAVYDDESSLNKVSDIWSYDDSVNGGSYIETYTIDSEGGIFGSDSEGCSFEGAIEIIDEDYNMYDLTLTASNCDDKDGTYIGKSFLSSESGEDDTLNTYLVGEDFNKQSGLLRQ